MISYISSISTHTFLLERNIAEKYIKHVLTEEQHTQKLSMHVSNDKSLNQFLAYTIKPNLT